MDDYIKELKYIGHYFSPKGGKGLKILTNKQMLNRLPILSLKYKQEIILNHLKMN